MEYKIGKAKNLYYIYYYDKSGNKHFVDKSDFYAFLYHEHIMKISDIKEKYHIIFEDKFFWDMYFMEKMYAEKFLYEILIPNMILNKLEIK